MSIKDLDGDDLIVLSFVGGLILVLIIFIIGTYIAFTAECNVKQACIEQGKVYIDGVCLSVGE